MRTAWAWCFSGAFAAALSCASANAAELAPATRIAELIDGIRTDSDRDTRTGMAAQPGAATAPAAAAPMRPAANGSTNGVARPPMAAMARR